ncbi:protein archease [Candidatus Bathyarchaeota archaeon]|nr:MAG: protein archease [Candidatus Bathyarchaeota archaeon]
MPGERGFEFLEHTADQYVRAYGPDLKAAFEEAAKGLFATMTDLSAVRPEEEVEVEVEGGDLKALLYNWLEALLVRFEIDGLLLSDFEVLEISGHGKGPYRLRARARGERFDPERHPQYVGVKAITYHLMEVEEREGRVELKFLLDI